MTAACNRPVSTQPKAPRSSGYGAGRISYIIRRVEDKRPINDRRKAENETSHARSCRAAASKIGVLVFAVGHTWSAELQIMKAARVGAET